MLQMSSALGSVPQTPPKEMWCASASVSCS